MTTLQLAMIAGALVGLGLATAVLTVAPTHPDLRDFLLRLNTPTQAGPVDTPEAGDYRDRMGVWLMRHLPLTRLLRPPTKELALLRMPLHRFYAEKFSFALVGMVFPTLAAGLLVIFGVDLPFVIPVIVALVAGLGLSFIPDLNVREAAKVARHEFRHALSAYVDLVAIARNSGAQPRQAMEMAARTGDSWVFTRINEELVDSRFSGRTPWDSLTRLADELEIPDLASVADIMRLSAEDNAAVYTTLRDRAASMRNALQSQEAARENEAAERASMPQALLLLVFLVALGTPVFLRAMGLA